MSIQYGVLHNHSEFSVKDSAMTLTAMFERAKELDAPAIALTDHGILAGFYDFIALGKQYGIKTIPGIEAYYVPDPGKDKNAHGTKRHLILMAKDMVGYRAICNAVYQSYAFSVDDYPRMTHAILTDCFGPKSAGHGHVIATSACIGGVLSKILLDKVDTEKATKSLHDKRDKYHPIDDELLDAVKHEEELLLDIMELVKQRDKLTAESKLTTTGMKRALKTMAAESDDYRRISAELKETQKRKDAAKAQLEPLKKQIALKRREKTAYSKSIEKMKASAERWNYYNEQINKIMAETKSDLQMRREALSAAKGFQHIFGKGNFFIELQYHRIAEEQMVMPVLADIAKEVGIPVVAANDAHYATNSRDDIRARTLVAALRFNTPIIEEVFEAGYGELYIKSDEELKGILSEILDADTVTQAMENIGVIVDMCNVEVERGEHYPVFVGGEPGETPAMRLRRLATEGIPKRYPGSTWTKEYEDRMNYELGVIDKMGYSDYLCIVQDFLDYGRSLGSDCPEGVGYTIGPGRGSAVGSIVCYLSGITSVDPMRYGLLFERFLNPDRVSMPDIDSDFHTEIRADVIEYVKAKYGEKAVCNILTKGTMAGRSAIRGVGRVTNVPDSIVDTVARMVPAVPNAKIDDAAGLDDYCNANPVVRSLVEDAKLIEGTIVNYGMHAAGVVISDNGDVGQYVAMMYNNAKEQWVAQCDMGQCETEAGLLKMDFLGLRNLDIITDTLRRIKRNYGVSIDIEAVDIEPEVFKQIFARGNTNSIFQFESSGMKSMLRQFCPDSMEDLILLVAAYRPGPMQSIPDIIKVKRGEMTPHYIANGLAKILGLTYGYPIYQEQVMQIFNKVAGFSLGESDIIRRAMSKKKIKILTDPKTDYHGKFIRGLMANGASVGDAESFWERLLDFAEYAFNKSHAAAYAHVAYYTAWLKYHYPAEYMCSVMTRTGFDKLPMLVAECRQMGLNIAPPDINSSLNAFMSTGNTIQFGFGNIKDVGASGKEIIERREKDGPYLSMKDFVLRTVSFTARPSTISKTAVTTLVEAGAFDLFCCGNRRSLLTGLEDLFTVAKKLKEQKFKADVLSADLELLEAAGKEEDAAKKARSLKACMNSLAKYQALFNEHIFLMVPEDNHTKLARECELLGTYVTGSPIDEYSEAVKLVKNVTEISALELGTKATICGIVTNLRILQRKSDGRPFCTMKLFDASGEIEVKVFTKEYEQFGDIIEEGAALTVLGRVRLDKAFGEDDSDTLSVSALDVRKLKIIRHERILISAPTIANWEENYEAIFDYKQDDGFELFFHDSMEGTMRACTFRVSESIVNLSRSNLLVSKMPT